MNETSAYVTAVLFMDSLKNYFVPRKESGNVLLMLDGQRSQRSEVNVLVIASENDIILLCLPRHTTHYLHTIHWSFFQALKTFWQETVNNWIYSNTVRKTKRIQFGTLLTAVWNHPATVGNGSAGFSACGVYHYDP
jgi:hypothetical protein